LGISSPTSKKVLDLYDKAIKAFGNELNILLFSDISDVSRVLGKEIANFIEAIRKNLISIRPGYDGLYGEIDENWKDKEWKIKGTLLDFIS